MDIKIIIKRIVSKDKVKEMIPYFRQIRALAIGQEGYISGETLKSLDSPESFMVISSWNSPEDWEKWMLNKERQEVQEKVDALLGRKTEYERFHYGYSE
jgi:heme-degrading monooxygenase HmoA